MSNYLIHSAKGTTWGNHKYLYKVNGRYVYDTSKPITEFNSDPNLAVKEHLLKKYKGQSMPKTVEYIQNGKITRLSEYDESGIAGPRYKKVEKVPYSSGNSTLNDHLTDSINNKNSSTNKEAFRKTQAAQRKKAELANAEEKKKKHYAEVKAVADKQTPKDHHVIEDNSNTMYKQKKKAEKHQAKLNDTMKKSKKKAKQLAERTYNNTRAKKLLKEISDIKISDYLASIKVRDDVKKKLKRYFELLK